MIEKLPLGVLKSTASMVIINVDFILMELIWRRFFARVPMWGPVD